MDLVRAIVLGIVQGLTEFIPVSSSGHLILIPALFNWPDQGLAFDAGLHGGTLLALLVYFHRDWIELLRSAANDVARHNVLIRRYGPGSQFLALLTLGTIPAGVAGLLFDSWIEDHLREAWIVAIGLAVAGGFMLIGDRVAPRTGDTHPVGLVDAIVVGIAQAFALIPGVSRSGATITAALFRGLDRPSAARFAFLLGTPAIAGAAILKTRDLVSEGTIPLDEVLLGMTAAALVGLLAIRFLLRYLQRGGLLPFVIYRWSVAIAALAIGAVRTL